MAARPALDVRSPRRRRRRERRGLADGVRVVDVGLIDVRGRRRGEPGRVARRRNRASLFRRVQTGLIQNYALLMLFGIFAFVSIYLFVR